ncbi:cupin domain-containing protein [Muricomes sp. OA1]|jgi:transcriptional regulator with XRE-family HTH domain|uniref:Cupin domain-containing protein n=1 Tax=Hungatella hathewayi TaxID=154046 RepID=A0A3E2WVP9_9FIRM|nr:MULTISPECIES: cupin domain-containing protein [Clostridia]MEE0202361.1 cupin domain-containing protein [Muricomes sp.]MCH1972268.1 cupin domain-containing protein [Muricomes sp. OA1]MRM89216.1 cupin domain-containing protein [Faecalicatena contorta]RGC31821.1 cupin domain-containing protein [Hungatella hathewayi]GKH31123.1 MerR family transcriptional regulator [Faecalicatena contorta]
MDLSKIGKTIKDKRQEMNLSLREVSALSQVAGSTISQIETGKTSPNLLTLKAICDTLDIPVFSLFLEEDSQVQLVRFRDQKSFVRNTSNGKALTESLIIHGKNEMYAATVTIPSGSDSGEFARHGGEEFVYVLQGNVTFELENNGSYELEEHDTLYYPNYIGHRWMNKEEKEAKILMVSTSPYTF